MGMRREGEEEEVRGKCEERRRRREREERRKCGEEDVGEV